MKILIHRTIPPDAADATRKQFPHHDIQFLGGGEPIGGQWDWMNVLLGNPDPRDVRDKGISLKWLQLLSSGIDGYGSLADAGIRVTTAHGIHAPVIAQHVLMTLLMMERKQRFFLQRQAARQWDRQARLPGLLRDRKIGLLGYGTIGCELVRLLSPLDVEIHAVTLSIPDGQLDYPNVRVRSPSETEEVLGMADHIVLALPLTPQTRHFLDRERLNTIKPGACLHNVGRGELIDEQALIEALQSGRIGGAALDVFEQEPLPASSPLWTMENCIITPHIAGHHSGLDIDILDLFARNLSRYDAGQSLINEANFSRGF